MKKSYLLVLSLSVVAVLSSCGVGREQGSALVGSKGGVVKLASGLELEIPPGAFSDDVTVSVTEVRGPNGEREIEVEPRGRELTEPAHLSAPDDSGAIEARRESGERIEVRHNGGRLEIEVHRFEHLHLGRHSDLDGGADDHGGRGADDDGGADDHGDGGHGADDLDGGADDHGDGGHGADDLDGGAVGVPGAACVVDDTCACGSECVSGQCTAVVTCTTDADCTGGARCREARRSGNVCGVSVCHL